MDNSFFININLLKKKLKKYQLIEGIFLKKITKNFPYILTRCKEFKKYYKNGYYYLFPLFH